MTRFIQTALILFFLPSFLYSQEPDSVVIRQPSDSIYQFAEEDIYLADTLVVEPDFSHSPSKAIMYALVLPGLGQAYNKKYYKMPIVWAAMGGAGYAIVFNTRQYRQLRKPFRYCLHTDATTKR